MPSTRSLIDRQLIHFAHWGKAPPQSSIGCRKDQPLGKRIDELKKWAAPSAAAALLALSGTANAGSVDLESEKMDSAVTQSADSKDGDCKDGDCKDGDCKENDCKGNE